MAIANKWKSSGNSPEISDSSMNTLDSIESQIHAAEEEAEHLGVRSDWTMQRKMGVAMGVVGAILVVVGIAPMVLDSDNLKGSLAESQEEAPDPLVALFGGGNTDAGTNEVSESTAPDDSQFAESSSSVGTSLPVETESFGGTEDTTIEVETNSSTVNVVLPENSGEDQFATMNLGGESVSVNTNNTSITSEVDQILAEESIIENGGTPINLSNPNTGMTDTLGSEFMTENPNAPSSVASVSSENFHASAGLQNISVKKTKLTNSGPEDMALIIFLLSLFIVGGVRYRKELF